MCRITEITYPAILLVEGKDDLYVIKNLCQRKNIPINFNIQPTEDLQKKEVSGIDELMKSIPIWVKDPRFTTIGIVVDADENLKSRWAAISKHLRDLDYDQIPTKPTPDGLVVGKDTQKRIGVWIMPDNRMEGILEDFVKELITDRDKELCSLIEGHLESIEQKKLNRYNPRTCKSKAYIHSWLACQETPGRTMGLAITCGYLSMDHPLAEKFCNWLKILFKITTS